MKPLIRVQMPTQNHLPVTIITIVIVIVTRMWCFSFPPRLFLFYFDTR